MGFINKDGMVRVDFFDEHHKWQATEAIDMSYHYKDPIEEGLKNAMNRQIKNKHRGLVAVCLVPYCQHPYPISFEWRGQ